MHECDHHKYLLGWYGLGKGTKGTIPFVETLLWLQ